METRDDILKELKELAPKLASLNKPNLYQVPEGYFLNFRNAILGKVKLAIATEELKEVAPELSKITRTTTAEIPSGYFNSFSTQLLDKIKANEIAAELEGIAPVLSKVEKVNMLEIYPLPIGESRREAEYFNSLPTKLMRKLREEQKPQSSSSVWINSLNNILDGMLNVVFKPKYSTAFAGITTMIIVGLMMFNKIQQCNDIDCRLAQLSAEEISTYLDNKSGVYSEQIFESEIDENILGVSDKLNGVHAYKDALMDIDDAALDAAIAN